jgi:hypothetical protein
MKRSGLGNVWKGRAVRWIAHWARIGVAALWGFMAAPGVAAQSAPPPDPGVLIQSFQCVVLLGKNRTPIRVQVISDPALTIVSMAERLPNSTDLRIRLNPTLMNRYRPVARLFWLEHECAHHTLGHTLRRSDVDPAQMGRDEDDADCTAIQTMIKGLPGQAPMIDAQGLATIEADVASLMRGGGYYKPGTERAQQIEACARRVGG